MSRDVDVLGELQKLVVQVQRQNARLKVIAVSIAALSVVVTIVVAGALATAADLRQRDLQNLVKARKVVRIAAAEGDLRGCRADEQQDSVLAGLLETALKIPRPASSTPTPGQRAARKSFEQVVGRARRGRHCQDQPLLLALTKGDRTRLLRQHPRHRG